MPQGSQLNRIYVQGPGLYQRIQGGLLWDSFASFFAALGTSLPTTTFAQNNGVIALTRCASRHSGLAAAFWLLFMGVFSKVAAVFTTIPDCVLGGMTTCAPLSAKVSYLFRISLTASLLANILLLHRTVRAGVR